MLGGSKTDEKLRSELPVKVPVTGFAFGKRLRVVLRPTDKKDKQFHVNLKNGEDIIVHFNPRLKVYSNGHLLHDFQERQSGWSITSIDIGGDVHVHSVQIE
ncbi:galactoside-binding lectin [Cooperia oncophora]